VTSTQTPVRNPTKQARVLRQLTIAGALLVVGYIGFFALMQSAAFYYANKPDPVQIRLHALFEPVSRLFPAHWLNVDRSDKFALVLVPPFLAVMLTIIGTLVYILRQVAKPNVFRPEYVGPALRRIFGFTIVILLILLWVRGLLTTDIYSYVWYSRVWVEHGASPYTRLPAEFAAQDPARWLDWVFWRNEPAVYGPVWLYVSGAAYKLGQFANGQFATHILSLRILADVAHLLNAALVWKIAGLIVRRREAELSDAPRAAMPRIFSTGRRSRLAQAGRRLRGTETPGSIGDSGLGLRFGALLFYIWNPLLLVEFGGNGHNDAVMLTFVLLAFWLHLLGRWRLAALALGLATLVKLVAILFLPGYLWLLLWDGYRAGGARDGASRYVQGVWRVIQAMAIVAVAWVVLYIPFWEGMQTLRVMLSGPANRWYLHSLGELAVQHGASFAASVASSLGVMDIGPEFRAQAQAYIEANVKVWMVVVAALIAIIVTWKARTFERALTAWGWVVFAGIIVQAWFWPWYVTWLVMPAALSSSRRLRITTLIFCASSLLHYIEEQVLLFHFNIFRDLSGALVMGPPLVYLLCSWLLEVRRNRRVNRQAKREVSREQPAVAHVG
jgi:alpha-1,6-mannosyltransferase